MNLRLTPAAAAILLIAACGGDAGPVTPEPPVVAQVQVSLPSATLYMGETAQLTVSVIDDDGRVMTANLTYASTAPEVASVNGSGLVSALAPGSTTLTASAGGKTGGVDLKVRAVPAAAVELTPERAVILTGDTLALTATVRDSTGAAIGGHTIEWVVSDTTVATVRADGRLVPRGAGSVTVTASTSGKTAEAAFEIHVGRGVRVPELAVFDSVIPALLEQHGLPGGSFALMKDGKLLLARSYGWADTTTRAPVEPASLFRYASLSKSMTAAAVMKLVEEGRLGLDEKVFTILDDLTPPDGATPDPRLGDITVRHALSHTAGWRAADTQDPLWSGRRASEAVDGTFPATARTYARYWMGLPLSFDPGTNWSYGQIGYVLLHLVVEEVTGMAYEDYVREAVLTPAGTAGRLGRTPLSGRLPGEVTYYYPGMMPDNTAPSGDAPAAYGWHSIEGNAAAAGWVGTAVEFLRFVAAIDGEPTQPDVLAEATLRQMFERPLSIWDPYTTWYGFGWYSRGGWPNPVIYHGGNTWGTMNWARRMSNGVSFVLLTNGPVTPEQSNPASASFNNTLVSAAGEVVSWPDHDYFDEF